MLDEKLLLESAGSARDERVAEAEQDLATTPEAPAGPAPSIGRRSRMVDDDDLRRDVVGKEDKVLGSRVRNRIAVKPASGTVVGWGFDKWIGDDVSRFRISLISMIDPSSS